MATVNQVEGYEVELTDSDLSALRENHLLSIPHPNGGIILLVTAEHFTIEKNSDIKRTPLLTGETMARLENGDRVNYEKLSLIAD